MLKSTLAGTVAAVIGVAITVVIADAVSGPLMVTSPGADAPEELALGAAIAGTVTGAIAGLTLAALCARFLASKAAAVFLGICLVGLVAYGLFSFSATEEVVGGVWLNVMHVVAAIPIVGLLYQQIGKRSAIEAAST